MLEGKPPFEELYGAFLQRVYAYVRAQLGGSADAEDVTSQVFIKAWEAYPRFEPQGATPSAWLFRIARNATLDHLRSSGRRDRLVRVVANEPEPVTDPSEVAREHIEYGQLMELVAELPERQREVIALPALGALVPRGRRADRVERGRGQDAVPPGAPRPP